MEKTFGLTTWFKVFCWVMVVICTVLIFMFPAALLMLWIALKARAVVRDDHLELTWIRTRTIPWSSISALKWAPGAGALGKAMRPLSYQLEGGKWGNIPFGTFADNEALMQVLREKTGLEPV